VREQRKGGLPGETVAKTLLITLVIIFVAIFAWHLGTTRLNGLLIDLEMGEPDPMRHPALRTALTEDLCRGTPALKDVSISLDYEHFTRLRSGKLNTGKVDFLVLSPQATPWHVYPKKKPSEFEDAKQFVRTAILDLRLPALGICGGHQMLALSFGGSVGFIDKTLDQQEPEKYPKEGLAERGWVIVETLLRDPIFSGIADHPGKFYVSQSHFEEVKSAPFPLVNLARSGLSEIQVLRLPERPVYGVAFHPERGWESCPDSPGTPAAGKQILVNFLAMVLNERQ